MSVYDHILWHWIEEYPGEDHGFLWYIKENIRNARRFLYVQREQPGWYW